MSGDLKSKTQPRHCWTHDSMQTKNTCWTSALWTWGQCSLCCCNRLTNSLLPDGGTEKTTCLCHPYRHALQQWLSLSRTHQKWFKCDNREDSMTPAGVSQYNTGPAKGEDYHNWSICGVCMPVCACVYIPSNNPRRAVRVAAHTLQSSTVGFQIWLQTGLF